MVRYKGVLMVKIENEKDVERFINSLPEGRRTDVASALFSRSALRVLPMLIRNNSDYWEDSIIFCSRALLTSCARANHSSEEYKIRLRNASADAALIAAQNLVYAGSDAAGEAYSAAYNYVETDGITYQISILPMIYSIASIKSIVRDTDGYPLDFVSLFTIISNDAERLLHDISNGFAHPLWPSDNLDQNPILKSEIETAYQTLLDYFDADPQIWGFWRKWFTGLWNGTPMDWALPTQVALIDNNDWEKGAAHLADKIREIEEPLNDTVIPAHISQEQIQKIIQNAPIVQFSMENLSHTITARIDLFERMAGWNEPIPFVETLKQMPPSADIIASLLAKGATNSEAELKLAQEVGRLQALVEQLRRDLHAANKELKTLKDKPRWLRPASVIGTCIGAAVTGIWVLSGSDLRLEDRYNNLAQDFTFLTSGIWSTADDCIEEPLQYQLPDSIEI